MEAKSKNSSSENNLPAYVLYLIPHCFTKSVSEGKHRLNLEINFSLTTEKKYTEYSNTLMDTNK